MMLDDETGAIPAAEDEVTPPAECKETEDEKDGTEGVLPSSP